MIDSQRLLQESRKLLKVLENDIRERLGESPELDAELKTEWEAARAANRTAGAYLDWREENITQSSVHWILACVFLRFLEDNEFLPRAYLTSADKEGKEAARDDYERYFRAHPNHSDLEYLLHAFREVSRLPGLKGLYDEQHNPLFRLPLSGDGGIALLGFWRKVDPDSGLLVHDFTDPNRETRFLGDIYQELSNSAKERYALLQTPEFVEEFVLDRTLTPAIDTFGYKEVRLIDPTCGSGHFLLGAFRRLFELWARKEPARNLPDLVQQALKGVYGVDINPFAVEIARFRLLVVALTASDIRKLKDAPDFRINLATGDSLLHGPRFGLRGTAGMFENNEDYASTGLAHAYRTEELPELQRILGQQYHAVVGNPPYITPKDSALRAEYRARYLSCHMKYSLGAPFTERFFELALPDEGTSPAGYVGMITANSFMKREFGKKLIEEFLPSVDLTHVIDTSGAHIPDHGTPTVILFGRHRRPVGEVIRTVMGIKGEPSKPNDAAKGLVWSAILKQIDQVGSESAFVSVADIDRVDFANHPWSIGGGGAADLRDTLETTAPKRLSEIASAIGVMVVTGEDDVFVRARMADFGRAGVPSRALTRFAEGDAVRDWLLAPVLVALYEYDTAGRHTAESALDQYFWCFRSLMRPAIYFGRTKEQRGMHWREYGVIVKDKLAQSSTIAFAEVTTHNHFVLERGPVVLKNSAPVIKLPAEASEEHHLGLLALLNSSTGCFWLKQVCQNKAGGGIGRGISDEAWENRFAFNATKVAEFPIIENRPVDLATSLDNQARQLSATSPDALLSTVTNTQTITRTKLDYAYAEQEKLRRQMIATQEELDWRVYRVYGLLPSGVDRLDWEFSSPPEVALGERAFEIVLARRMMAGEEQTTWFERHNSEPITEIPAHWPANYRALVEQRIALIESDRNIGLIERPEYKRRWKTESWEEQEKRALREWLLDRLETERYWPRTSVSQLRSVHRLSDAVRRDTEFMQVAALYTGRDDFDVNALVSELTESEAVPYLAAWRYTDDGMRKREAWEETWALQRREDEVDARVAAANPRNPDESEEAYRKRLAPLQRAARLKEVGEVPVPPKYKSSDFRSATYWRLRGALDVPKERFISYPAATPDADGTLLVGWGGWHYLQQATALAGHYLHLKENEGWPAERLIPLVAGLLELVPWLKQWHNEWNPEHDARMGDYFEGFAQEEARALDTTIEALQKWRPAQNLRRKRRA